MKTKKYIRNRLENLISKISNIRILYEYLDYSDTHLVEILPLTEYMNNTKIIEFEKEFMSEFDAKFFPSVLLLVSEDSINHVENPEWILAAKDYERITIEDEPNIQFEIPEHLNANISLNKDNSFFLAA